MTKPLAESIAALLLILDGKGEGVPKNLDQRLADAKAGLTEIQTQVDALTRERDQAKTDLQTMKDENARLQQQFDALTGEATTAKADVTRLTGELASEKSGHGVTKTQLETANSNIGRLEALCGVKGIDPNQAVTPLPEPKASTTTASFDARLKAEKDPGKRAAIRKEFSEAAKEGRVTNG